MPNYFNDSPIEDSESDRYGVAPFAGSIAKSILNIRKPVGTTIALHGPWGSGKSSVVNLVRTELQDARDSSLVVSEFKCWWYRGEDALALAFLQNLHTTLRDSIGERIKDFIPDMTRYLLQAGPVIGQAVSLASGQAWTALIPGSSKFISTFFPKGETVEKIFRKLSKALEEEKRRFLVIIDDIDRLNPDEALAIFRLVKSVGRLPNVMYLLVFDRDLAEKAVQARYPSEGPHFLEKIVQAGFELPPPLQADLNDAVFAAISDICGTPGEAHVVRTMNLFYDAVAPYITTPRHVARFQNAISVTWPAIAHEVNLADFLALEAIRLNEPGLFKAIRSGKGEVCGVRRQGDPDQRDETRFDRFLSEVPSNRRGIAGQALQRLFPRLESMGYGGEWTTQWSSERRVCVDAHFDTYFRLSLSDQVLPSKEIDELVARADERAFVQEKLRTAARTEHKRGKSLVPTYLSELTTHADRIEKRKVEAFLSALFEIHDEINLEKDAEKGLGAFGNTSLRFHWLIRRLTRDRFSLDERTDVYVSAVRNSALGWLANFVSSARSDYYDREGGPRRVEDCLVAEPALQPLTERALQVIRASALEGSLLDHPDLVSILYRWREFLNNDPAEVRCWTDNLMTNDHALVTLARALTGKSWSAGLGVAGSLGDRVSKGSITAQISNDIDVLDPTALRSGLERIVAEATMEAPAIEIARTFLEAWDRKRGSRSG